MVFVLFVWMFHLGEAEESWSGELNKKISNIPLQPRTTKMGTTCPISMQRVVTDSLLDGGKGFDHAIVLVPCAPSLFYMRAA